MSETYLSTIRCELEQILALYSDPPVILGAIPKAKDISFESRHLGLIMPDEISNIQEQIQAFAQLIREHIDIEDLIRIAKEAEPVRADAVSNNIISENKKISGKCGDRPVLAVAKDEAFCFYYDRNIQQLYDSGCEIRYFSPLHDKSLPEGTAGLLLGGGYPELFAKELSDNHEMRQAVRDAIGKGIPSLAECGGFMYLGAYIEDENKQKWPMAGILEEGFANAGRLNRFGYVTVTPQKDGLLQAQIRGHEFHYYDADNCGSDCLAIKPSGNRSWPCMYMGTDHLWGFPHLYYPSWPDLTLNFVKAMRDHMKTDKRA